MVARSRFCVLCRRARNASADIDKAQRVAFPGNEIDVRWRAPGLPIASDNGGAKSPKEEVGSLFSLALWRVLLLADSNEGIYAQFKQFHARQSEETHG